MKVKRTISLTLAILFTLMFFSAKISMAQAADDVTVIVESIKGTVTFKRASSEKTTSAFVGLKLKQGDVVTTGKGGEVVVNIGNDKTIKALSESSFKISSLSGTDDDSKVGFTLIKGTVFNEVKTKNSNDETLTIKTGNVVAGVRGTTFTVNMRGADGTTVHTLEGTVFLEQVIKRLMEGGDNAALTHEQTEVGAGQGGGLSGVYTLDIKDLLPDELAYIVNNPELFDEKFVTDATQQLENLPTDPDSGEGEGGEEPPPDIEYQPDPPAGGSSSSGSGSGTRPSNTYTVTFINPPTNSGFNEFYTPTGSIQVEAGARLPQSVPIAGKMGFAFLGWFTEDTGPNCTTRPAGADAYWPDDSPEINSNLTLYPCFEPILSQDGGSPTNAYIITPENFAHFRYFVHANLGRYYKLGYDINFADYGPGAKYNVPAWQPIGDSAAAFTGSFEGGGYTIHNFNVSSAAGSENCQGFFGRIGGSGSVQELTFNNASVTATGATSMNVCAGIIVGECGSGTSISNCTVTGGTVRASNSMGDAYAGGIVGYFGGSLIGKCSVSGVTVESGASFAYAGGITGYAGAGATIECSSAKGGTTVRSLSSAANIYIGGILGSGVSTSLSECYTENVTVTAGTGVAIYAGGLAGHLAGSSVSNCYAIASVTINAGSDGIAGGIVGGTNNSQIQRCYFAGSVGVTVTTGGIVGGIAGEAGSSDSLTRCVAYSGGISVQSGGTARRILGTGTGTLNFNYVNGSFTVNGTSIPGSDPSDANGLDVSPSAMDEFWFSDDPIDGFLLWDFANTWVWQTGGGYASGGYPRLRNAP